MCGGAWTVAPHRYSDTFPGTRGRIRARCALRCHEGGASRRQGYRRRSRPPTHNPSRQSCTLCLGYVLSVRNGDGHTLVIWGRGGDGVTRDDDRADSRRRPVPHEVERPLAERGDPLMATAIALAGNRPEGEDLLQAALERLLRHWSRIDADPEFYLRRTLYNMAVDGWRRRRLAAQAAPDRRPTAAPPAPTRSRWSTCGTRSPARWPSCHPGSARSWCCATGRNSARLKPRNCSAGRRGP